MRSLSLAVPFVMASFVLLLVLAPTSDAAITCGDVAKKMGPCVKYLQSGSGMPPGPCCAGVSALASAAQTTADKQAACGCLKTQSTKLNINAQLAKSLPGNCGISLPYPISTSVDCSTIH